MSVRTANEVLFFVQAISLNALGLEYAYEAAYDPSSATRPTGRFDCNSDAMAGLDAWLRRQRLAGVTSISSVLIVIGEPPACLVWIVTCPVRIILPVALSCVDFELVSVSSASFGMFNSATVAPFDLRRMSTGAAVFDGSSTANNAAANPRTRMVVSAMYFVFMFPFVDVPWVKW